MLEDLFKKPIPPYNSVSTLRTTTLIYKRDIEEADSADKPGLLSLRSAAARLKPLASWITRTLSETT